MIDAHVRHRPTSGTSACETLQTPAVYKRKNNEQTQGIYTEQYEHTSDNFRTCVFGTLRFKFCACTKLETYCRRTKQTSPNTKRIWRIIAGHMKNIKRTLTNTNGFAKIPSVSYTEDRSGVV